MKRLTVFAILLLSGCAHRQPAVEPTRSKSELTLTAYPSVLARPGWVRLTARLSEGADIERLSCSAFHWNWGDNESSLQQVFTNCEGVPRAWVRLHVYRSYGEFKPAFYLRSQVDGSILAWAEATVLVVNPEAE